MKRYKLKLKQVPWNKGKTNIYSKETILKMRKARLGVIPSNYNGGKYTHGRYIKILFPEHTRSDSKGYVLEHIIIVEIIFGKPLPNKAVVHHFDEDCKNNNSNNLILCENQSYHKLLHYRTRAYKKTGNANKLRCCYCKKWDDKENLYLLPNISAIRHKKCYNEYKKKWYKNAAIARNELEEK